MRTIESTYAAPGVGAGTGEKSVPEGMRKLGRLAVWAVAGGQFIDLIWSDQDDSRDGGAAACPGGRQLTQAELADLIRRAEPRRFAC